MMNQEQRKNEIMRRSRRRIQLRRRVITACVPLVLCAAALSAWLFSGGVSQDSALHDVVNVNRSESALLPESGQTSQQTQLICAQVDSRTYTDRKLLDLLEELLELPAKQELACTPDNGLVLLLTDSRGSQITLSVTPHILSGPDGQQRELKEEQYERLLELLEVAP